ncbi:lasso peptide biosynthesis PqqD family chaperone [Paenibacillus rigui]|uniref:PqqD family protein n=1 Tax=Paenibacillus rigui TaxID=554312 RepID=A0A229UP76_9BACL|nr:lasso peptide biosynthesis PqqD family chaperone [Paenibacillus rigui]OXM85212.1 PqqD family protein [Paenibacillus rigui]
MMTNKTVSLKESYVQAKGNIVSDMGGEKVMLSVHNGKYYNLGEVGGTIWDCLAVPASVQEVVSALMSEYQVEQGECEQQVVSFMEHLLEEKLIGIHS